MLTALALLAAAPVDAAPSPDSQGVAIMCDPVRYRFSLRAEATAAALDHSYPIARFVPYDALFFADGLPGWTNQPDVLGPLIRYERCGPYTFRLEGDALNMHVQGEAGAYPPFASVRVLRGAGQAFPLGGPLRLASCDRTLPRARDCPDGYAVRLDGRYDAARRRLRLKVTTRSIADDDETMAQTRVQQVEVDDDLSAWQP